MERGENEDLNSAADLAGTADVAGMEHVAGMADLDDADDMDDTDGPAGRARSRWGWGPDPWLEVDARVEREVAQEVARIAVLVGIDEVWTGVTEEQRIHDSRVIRVVPAVSGDVAADAAWDPWSGGAGVFGGPGGMVGPADPVDGGDGGADRWTGPGDPAAVRIDGEGRTYTVPRDAVALGVALRERAPQGRARVVGVLGATGGLGVSSLAAVFARASRLRGWETALVDLDPLPGACAEMLALDDAAGLRWADLAHSGAPLIGAHLASSVPTWHGVRVLCGDERGGPAPGVATAAVAALRSDVDVLVLDLPRGAWAATSLLASCDEVVVLVGAAPSSLVTLRSLWAALDGLPARAGLAVRRTSRYSCPAQGAAQAAGLPLLGVVGDERGMADALAVGDGPWLGARGPLRRMAAAMLDAYGLTDNPAAAPRHGGREPKVPA